MLELAYLIPLFPLVSFLITIAFDKKLPGKGAYIPLLAIFISLVFSVLIAAEIFSHPEPISSDFPINWINFNLSPQTLAKVESAPTNHITFQMGYLVDPLCAVMLIVVCVVSFLVHLFSIGYMNGDIRYSRFFAYLSLFSASMLGLVIADNLLLLYICWEGVGVCSYFLIGFWFEKDSAKRAAKKAFLITRTGDVGLFLALILLFTTVGSFGFSDIFNAVLHGHISALNFSGLHLSSETVITIIAICIFFGAVGKSAQFPLHVWLPDAMEGPTPVSALIHAATMVAAGVYLVARCFPIFSASEFALSFVAHIGAITALMAATIALVQTDIKRVLAYSTISQLGYMMIALGCGGLAAGVFHLTTHAFFKALLFLGSGSVIHAVHTQEIWEMGGLSKKMKITFYTFIIGSLALAGIPPLAGFWSKDEVLLSAFNYFHETHHLIPFLFAVIGAFLTAFYMTRLCWVTFFGNLSEKSHQAHESPLVMSLPLVILAVLAVIAGFVGTPFAPKFQEYISPDSHEKANYFLMVASILIASSGIIIGYIFYATKLINRAKIISVFPFNLLYKLFKNKYYFDEIYDLTVIKLIFIISAVLFWIDKNIVDGFVNLVGKLNYVFSLISNLFDKYVVDLTVNLAGIITRGIGKNLRYIQTGFVQNYILIAFLGLILILSFRMEFIAKILELQLRIRN